MGRINLSWIRGFCDRASQVHAASRSIFITSKDQQILRDTFTFLVKEKFTCRWSNLGTRFGLRVSGVRSLLRWKSRIGFSNPHKTAQLDLIIGMYSGGPRGN